MARDDDTARPGENDPSENAVEHDFTIPADADVESGEDEGQPA